MADYANDEEQLDALKNWWAENGQTVIIAAVIGISVVIGGNIYVSSRTETLYTASDIYQQQYVLANETANDTSTAVSLADDYANTPYAALANLADARQSVTDGDLENAAEKLRWVADNSEQVAVAAQAQLRLASILVAQQKYDQALTVVNAIEVDNYGASIEELKGDIAAGKGDFETARNAYQGALTQVHKAIPQHTAIIQLKLDGLRSH